MYLTLILWLILGFLALTAGRLLSQRVTLPSMRLLLSAFTGGVAGLMAGLILATLLFPFVGLSGGRAQGWEGFGPNYIQQALFFGLGSLTALIGVFAGLAAGRRNIK